MIQYSTGLTVTVIITVTPRLPYMAQELGFDSRVQVQYTPVLRSHGLLSSWSTAPHDDIINCHATGRLLPGYSLTSPHSGRKPCKPRKKSLISLTVIPPPAARNSNPVHLLPTSLTHTQPYVPVSHPSSHYYTLLQHFKIPTMLVSLHPTPSHPARLSALPTFSSFLPASQPASQSVSPTGHVSGHAMISFRPTNTHTHRTETKQNKTKKKQNGDYCAPAPQPIP
ncbi:hypothetical protein L873DRAFT_1223551 [Choiromyces venosus 120613-1]|uniref:Uncharacterized protein n=1 Tax=Choiromyces venosus 120613-1 TaxID=1336337 RepID=A0A3N4JDT8_9PEZI|nr:hypothetical protein L873DRAFT_1223551 [Choiromyces venosus 120613-1]